MSIIAHIPYQIRRAKYRFWCLLSRLALRTLKADEPLLPEEQAILREAQDEAAREGCEVRLIGVFRPRRWLPLLPRIRRYSTSRLWLESRQLSQNSGARNQAHNSTEQKTDKHSLAQTLLESMQLQLKAKKETGISPRL